MPRDFWDIHDDTPAEYDHLTKVRIGMPVDMEVLGILLQMIQAVWPGATMLPSKGGHTVFGLDLAARQPGAIADLVAAAEVTGELDPLLAGAEIQAFGPQGLKVRSPEDAAGHLASLFRPAFGPAAINYVEMPLVDGITVIVLYDEGLTPHQLRERADERVKVLEAQLVGAGIEPEPEPPGWWARANADGAWFGRLLKQLEQFDGPDEERDAFVAEVQQVLDEVFDDRRRATLADRFRTQTNSRLEAP